MNGIRNKHILLVDDDPGILRALDKVLSSEGAVVTCAEWAGDAVDFLTQRHKPFDLVITDLRMPMMTGMPLIDAIHKIFPLLPVLVLTAFGTPEMAAACRKLGAVAVLEKPLNSARLLVCIENTLAASILDPKTKSRQAHQDAQGVNAIYKMNEGQEAKTRV